MAAAALLTAGAYWPIVAHPNSTVVGKPGDMTSSARDYWAAEELGKTPFTLVHDTLFRAPEGRTVSPAVQVANAVQPTFILAFQAFAGYLGAFNLFMLVGVVASLVATYWLLTSNGIHGGAAAASAIAFASSPWTVEQLLYGHSAFAHMWVYPVLLLTLCWAIRGSRLRSIVPGIALALAFYASSYLGLFACLVGLVFLLAYVIERGRVLTDVAARAGIALSTLFIAMLPTALATRITGSADLGLPSLNKSDLFGASVSDFFLPSAHSPVYGALVRRWIGEHAGESVVFYGYATLLLAAMAVVILWRTSKWSLLTRFALLAIAFGWLMALPAGVTIAGREIPLPTAANVIGEFVSWWRIYSRFASVAGFGLAILAAITLNRLFRSGNTGRVALGLLAASIMVVEAVPGAPVAATRLHVDPVSAWLRANPGGIVASYPIVPGPRETDEWDRTYWTFYYLQTHHRHPIFDPPRGIPRPTDIEIASLLAFDISEPRTVGILSAAGVRWIVVRDELYGRLGLPRPRLGPGLSLEATVPGARIFRVVAPPIDLRDAIDDAQPALARALAGGDASIAFGPGFYAPEEFNGYLAARWMSQDGKVHIRPSIGRPFVVYRLTVSAFSANRERRLTILNGSRRIATFTVPRHEVFLRTRLALPAATTLTLHAHPGPESLGPTDRRTGSVFVQSLSVEPIDLRLHG